MLQNVLVNISHQHFNKDIMCVCVRACVRACLRMCITHVYVNYGMLRTEYDIIICNIIKPMYSFLVYDRQVNKSFISDNIKDSIS